MIRKRISYLIGNDKATYFLSKLMLVGARGIIPFVCLYQLNGAAEEIKEFSIAWTYGFVYLAVMSAGFHDYFLRGKSKLEVSKYFNISAILIFGHFLITSLMIVTILPKGTETIHFFVLTFNFSYSLSILAERSLLFFEKRKTLIIYSAVTATANMLCLAMFVLFQISTNTYLALLSIINMLLFSVFSRQEYTLTLQPKTKFSDFLTYYRRSLPLTIQVILLGVLSRVEQYFFVTYSDPKNIVSYFAAMRCIETLYIFLSFNSQFNLVQSFSKGKGLAISSYNRFALIVFLMATAVTALATITNKELQIVDESLLYTISLCLPLVLLKALYNYFLDTFKAKSQDNSGIKAIIISSIASTPLILLLISNYGIIGAIASSYVTLVVFVAIAISLQAKQPQGT